MKSRDGDAKLVIVFLPVDRSVQLLASVQPDRAHRSVVML